jgi:DNA-binding response OmpR family regulator
LAVDSGAVTKPRTILVVDDEAAIRLLCRVNLELEGYTILEAGGIAEARGVLEHHEVDAILLDRHLRGEDGRELLRELRDADRLTPVAFLTGDSDDTAGAEAVLRKPFGLDELSRTVRRLLNGTEARIP